METTTQTNLEMLKTAVETLDRVARNVLVMEMLDEHDEKLKEEASFCWLMNHRARTALEGIEAAEANRVERLVGWMYDWSMMTQLAEAEAQMNFWVQVMEISSPSREEPMLTIDGCRKALKIRMREVLGGHNAGGSSNAFANALDAVKAEVNRQLIGTFGSMMGWGDLEF